jgi:hypothetical protein
MHAPAILLLDEPLGALDALTRLGMQQLIESFWQRQRFSAAPRHAQCAGSIGIGGPGAGDRRRMDCAGSSGRIGAAAAARQRPGCCARSRIIGNDFGKAHGVGRLAVPFKLARKQACAIDWKSRSFYFYAKKQHPSLKVLQAPCQKSYKKFPRRIKNDVYLKL